MSAQRPFLTAEWRHLLMINYEVDPAVLRPLLPAGTQLDLWQGKALASVVGFRFLKTRVMGIPVPFHTTFDEVNLRFYVCRDAPDGLRRGVVFVKEIVPRPAIATVARVLYGENYVALPMQHTIEQHAKIGTLADEALAGEALAGEALAGEALVEYAWRYRGRLNRMGALTLGAARPLEPGSEAEFITEHYWGYTRRGERRTGEYRVEHPAWNVWQVTQPYLLCNVRSMYGDAFEPFLHNRPRSAFLAEGSRVAVYPGQNMHHPRSLP